MDPPGHRVSDFRRWCRDPIPGIGFRGMGNLPLPDTACRIPVGSIALRNRVSDLGARGSLFPDGAHRFLDGSIEVPCRVP